MHTYLCVHKVDAACAYVCVCSELSQQMALEKLRESMRCRQHTMLKNAIDDCERFDKLKENKEVRNANRTLAVIEARQGEWCATYAATLDTLYRPAHIITVHKPVQPVKYTHRA